MKKQAARGGGGEMIDPGLKDKVALITGGNNPFGIGAAIVRVLASHGARVFIHYFRQPNGLPDDRRDRHATGLPGLAFFYEQQAKTAEEMVASIREAGGEAESWEADLGEPGSPDRLVEQAEGAFGHVDILVNNAAHYSADTFVQSGVSDEDPALWEDGSPVATIDSSIHNPAFRSELPCRCTTDESVRRSYHCTPEAVGSDCQHQRRLCLGVPGRGVVSRQQVCPGVIQP
ncbi:MAG: SDR family NAD(P)-dependent oxidoreductase [Armatimonadota bacterium]